MGIVLGSYTFDEARTTVTEQYCEVGGSDARVVTLKGILEGAATAGDLEDALDEILDAASQDGEGTALLLREDRQLFVRRTGFSREIQREALVGRFELELEAADPYERSTAETSSGWIITDSGATKALGTQGNVDTLPVVTLLADGTVTDPAVGDGVRSILYAGDVCDGETLVFDGPSGCVTLEGEDVTPYTEGLFPVVSPGGTTLTYTDGEDSSHSVSATVAFRDQWW